MSVRQRQEYHDKGNPKHDVEHAGHALDPRDDLEEIEVEKANRYETSQHQQHYLPLLHIEVRVVGDSHGDDGVGGDIRYTGEKCDPGEGSRPSLNPCDKLSDWQYDQRLCQKTELLDYTYWTGERRARTSARCEARWLARPIPVSRESAGTAYVLRACERDQGRSLCDRGDLAEDPKHDRYKSPDHRSRPSIEEDDPNDPFNCQRIGDGPRRQYALSHVATASHDCM